MDGQKFPELWELLRRYTGVMAGYKQPPENRQFGKPEGNPQGKGFFKKEDTPRYWLEQLAKMNHRELDAVISDEEAPVMAQEFAKAIKRGNCGELCGIINQVYGRPPAATEARAEPLGWNWGI